MNKDELYMQRAIDLAKNGFGSVSPNPMVGAVVVYKDKIVGEGWHREYGGPHAEVNALASVSNPEILSESTVYVTLEPCSHYGKTPPCADLLIKHEIKRVVVCVEDPNPEVSGRGIKRLRDAGIEVVTNVLEEEGKRINRRFFVNQLKSRPYVILKWAETSDGYLARTDGSSKWISSPESRVLVHKWRAEEDSILVGANTAITDDPSLNVRDWQGPDPVRVVLDPDHSLPGNLKLFQDGGPTLCYTREFSGQKASCEWIALGNEYSVQGILKDLFSRKIGSLLVEGGSKTLNQFIRKDVWDEARIFVSRQTFGDGTKAPRLPANALKEEINFTDRLLYYENIQ
ncbi:bifunctional diaminohydroxyphosphoribosylaminopyrimidine deaminase/5-amino-6-(5-phosphoribosylamino)uracil reductase RibD [Fulvivirga sedimenti]|uniref:Riboflavin biosynthesis protein RibD n=1 Tax=Fulvivirga sedimenti TaxID=2879465 RepID=A0A9X1HWV1_9BACT|nr:bifunctional diaminohydroxyphosphoribosylaminopyrimidine deaminase/5-amino-6-(5-phosphoribosylamino)uracil reductase RibD [Fulvivirga sedimenti]MCA6078252.1 bifunctional diaminohydroxyphosphoribosylaminopyrimidine deaminase/5-amino-6-(5-phosphoribosylamino)uracil reductase RibD [Fulvivirga sedimenti]